MTDTSTEAIERQASSLERCPYNYTQLAAATLRALAAERDALRAEVARLSTVEGAAKVLLDLWLAFICGEVVPTDASRTLSLASCFGAQAFALTANRDARPGAMMEALLQAMVDPSDTSLDWLRAKNRAKLAEGER